MKLRALCLALCACLSIASPALAEAPGSVPDGFTSQFKSVDGVRLHYVSGGKGSLVLLVHGFGQDWYKWRVLMPILAKDFTVVAVELPGLGQSAQPVTSYTGQDTAAVIYDFAKTFSPSSPFNLVAHDIGVWNTYPMVAQHPTDVRSVIFIEAPIPDKTLYNYPAFAPTGESLLWHFSFFAAKGDLAEKLVTGKERLFFDHFIRIHSGNVPISQTEIDYYADTYAKPGVLHAAMGYYQDLNRTIEQNAPYLAKKLAMPLLAIGGGNSFGAGEGRQISPYASNMESKVIPGCGHWLPEECEAPTDALVVDFLRRNGH